MRIKIVKCEARNAVNIGNIDKFRNEAVDDFKLMDAGHDLFRGSLSVCLARYCTMDWLDDCMQGIFFKVRSGAISIQ
jgi:hypothetical protein